MLPEGEVIGPLGPGGPVRSLPYAPALLEAVGPILVRTFLTIEEEFTDNANQTKENRKSEFRTSVAPGLGVGINRPQASLNLVYVPRFVIRNDRPQDTSVENDLTLRGAWSPTAQTRLGLAEDFTRSLDFRSVGDIGTRRTGQAPFIRNAVAIDAGYASPRGVQAGLSYANTLIRNDAPGADNSSTHTVQTNVEFNGPRFGLGASYALTREEFDIASPFWAHSMVGRASRVFTPTLDGTLSGNFTNHNSEGGQDFMIYGAGLGGTKRLGSGGSLSVFVGPQVFAPRGATARIRPTGSVAWSQPFASFSLKAQYSAGFSQNFQAVDNTGVTFRQSASVSLVSSAFRDLVATLGLGWAENRFQQTTLAVGPAGTVDRTWNADLGIRYYLLRWLSLTFGYTLTMRTSTETTAGFLENRVRLGLTAQYTPF